VKQWGYRAKQFEGIPLREEQTIEVPKEPRTSRAPLVLRGSDVRLAMLADIPDRSELPDPKGWVRTKTSWMVDHSGLGSPGELALTTGQFIKVLGDRFATNPRDGYAITDIGQFQLYVTVFQRVKKTKENKS
jgi:hypothetical protein